MFDQLEKYKNNGHFFFKKGDDIIKLAQKLPNKPGVFYILKLIKNKIKIVYVGKSDSSKTNNKTLDQLFNDREKGISLHEYFDKKCEEENIDALDIYWFDTENDNPSGVANEILQHNYDFFGSLPDWNKSFK
jgi:hypothetical protein